MWEHLNRQGIRVAKCTVERLMRAHGWRGVTRARTVRTTIADPAHGRAPDLVRRNFTADRVPCHNSDTCSELVFSVFVRPLFGIR